MIPIAELPLALQLAWAAVFGLVVGSFLNVAIHRLPAEGLSIFRPLRSFCPACEATLSWMENLPVASWMLQGGRCRHCSARISWRYPLVELLTAGLWCLAVWRTPLELWPLLGVHLLVLSGLLVATFVDFDRFEIPDEVSIGGMILAPLLSFLVPSLHVDSWVARELSGGAGLEAWAALVASLAGLAVGAGVLLFIGMLGRAAFGRDAMGLGDVKLLAAGGGFIGPGGALVALVVASVLASIAGGLNIVRFALLSRARARQRGRPAPWSRSLRTGRIAGRYVPFGPYLGMGIGIVLLAWNHVRELFLS